MTRFLGEGFEGYPSARMRRKRGTRDSEGGAKATDEENPPPSAIENRLPTGRQAKAVFCIKTKQ